MMERRSSERLWTKDFILLGLGNFFTALGFYYLIPTLPLYVTRILQSDMTGVGLALSVYTLSALLIRPVTGYLMDRYGRKWIYLSGVVLFALLFIPYSWAGTLVMLLGIRFIHGFAWGVTTTGNSTVVVDIIPARKRGEGIGIFGLSFTIAMAIGPLIGLEILGSGRYVLLFNSSFVTAAVGLLLLFFVRYPDLSPTSGKRSFRMRNIFEQKTLPMAFVQMLFGITYGTIISFLALYAREIQIDLAGTYFLVLALGITCSRLFGGSIFDRKGPAVLLRVGLLMTAVGFAFLSLVQEPIGFIISAILIGIGSGIIMPTIQTMANNVVDQSRRGIANASIITAFDIGIGLGALVLGSLSDLISLGYIFLICVVILLGAFYYFSSHMLRYYRQNQLPFTH